MQGLRVSAVAAGANHTLALSEAGDVFSFGAGQDGRLGHGDVVDQHTPRLIVALHGVRVCAVAAGSCHSLVVSAAGRLYSFGYDVDGRLGHGDRANQLAPRLVAALQAVRVSAVVAGINHSLALSEGNVYSLGRSDIGQLGHGNTAVNRTPLMIAGLQDVHVRSVAAGDFTSLAVTIDGDADGWGRGLGNDRVPHPVLGLLLTEDQLVPCMYPGLCMVRGQCKIENCVSIRENAEAQYVP